VLKFHEVAAKMPPFFRLHPSCVLFRVVICDVRDVRVGREQMAPPMCPKETLKLLLLAKDTTEEAAETLPQALLSIRPSGGIISLGGHLKPAGYCHPRLFYGGIGP
jgi:hypothetical protein